MNHTQPCSTQPAVLTTELRWLIWNVVARL